MRLFMWRLVSVSLSLSRSLDLPTTVDHDFRESAHLSTGGLRERPVDNGLYFRMFGSQPTCLDSPRPASTSLDLRSAAGAPRKVAS